MKTFKMFAVSRIPLRAIAIFLGGLSILLVCAEGQTPGVNPGAVGENAVWVSTSSVSGSPAFIDASVFSGSDICVQIHTALTSLPAGLVDPVIDARGIIPTAACSMNPWTGFTAPSTVLLPSGTIMISSTWALPDRTRLIGEGMNNTVNGTIIQAESSVASPMIQYCTAVCSGVSVQSIFLDGNNLNIVGIENDFGQALSYVDHVNLRGFTGATAIGLKVTATNSGPYSNLQCSPGYTNSSGVGNTSGECVELQASSTRGIHGITCTSASAGGLTPTEVMNAAILVDGSNNSIEDVHIEGFMYGILVGSNANAQSNVLSNIDGGNGSGPIGDLVHFSTVKTVTDVTAFAIRSTTGVTNTIQDDVTPTTISEASDAWVGMYVLGGQFTIGTSNIGFTRFATTLAHSSPPSIATWVVGSVAPSGSCPTGAIFSNTSSSGGTLWVCANQVWKLVH